MKVVIGKVMNLLKRKRKSVQLMKLDMSSPTVCLSRILQSATSAKVTKVKVKKEFHGKAVSYVCPYLFVS